METLLKWPGGKGREFEAVRAQIPPFTTYVEPFFGGGAFFFRLMPRRALISDVNDRLVKLYRYVQAQDQAFEGAVFDIVCWWEWLEEIVCALQPPFLSLYDAIRHSERPREGLAQSVHGILDSHEAHVLARWQGFFGDAPAFWRFITDSLVSKIGRLPKLERDNDVQFSPALMHDHIETAVRAGYYTYLRDGFVPHSEPEAVAQFYFLREFCYGSMFRFNKDGKFNIPYGGIAYNSKDFRGKARRLFEDQTQRMFSRTQIFNLDFRAFFEAAREHLTEEAFCFLDPPYHTEFSAYDNLAFTLDDQTDLADIFAGLHCKAMLIIKDTEFIRDLYGQAQRRNSRIEIGQYEKTYAYNMRGRNDRDVQHLLIRNYALAEPRPVPNNAALSLFSQEPR